MCLWLHICVRASLTAV